MSKKNTNLGLGLGIGAGVVGIAGAGAAAYMAISKKKSRKVEDTLDDVKAAASDIDDIPEDALDDIVPEE